MNPSLFIIFLLTPNKSLLRYEDVGNIRRDRALLKQRNLWYRNVDYSTVRDVGVSYLYVPEVNAMI